MDGDNDRYYFQNPDTGTDFVLGMSDEDIPTVELATEPTDIVSTAKTDAETLKQMNIALRRGGYTTTYDAALWLRDEFDCYDILD